MIQVDIILNKNGMVIGDLSFPEPVEAAKFVTNYLVRNGESIVDYSEEETPFGTAIGVYTLRERTLRVTAD